MQPSAPASSWATAPPSKVRSLAGQAGIEQCFCVANGMAGVMMTMRLGTEPASSALHTSFERSLALSMFVPAGSWETSYGLHPERELLYNLPSFDPRSSSFAVDPYLSGSEASRAWMLQRSRWTQHQGIASGATFAKELDTADLELHGGPTVRAAKACLSARGLGSRFRLRLLREETTEEMEEDETLLLPCSVKLVVLSLLPADVEEDHEFRQKSPSSWEEEVFYSILVDRFANGDITNDNSNIPDFQRDQLKNKEPWSVARWRHGGDLHGVKARLSDWALFRAACGRADVPVALELHEKVNPARWCITFTDPWDDI
eukprot:g20261.t1